MTIDRTLLAIKDFKKCFYNDQEGNPRFDGGRMANFMLGYHEQVSAGLELLKSGQIADVAMKEDAIGELANYKFDTSEYVELPVSNPIVLKLLNERSQLALKLGRAEKEIERLKEFEWICKDLDK